jgi:hypothetical protein
MEAWRSNGPRQSVWEDALLDGLIQVENGATLNESKVILNLAGRGCAQFSPITTLSPVQTLRRPNGSGTGFVVS